MHKAANVVDSMRWLLTEMGANGLSGFMLRGQQLVHTCRVDEDGYVPPLRDGDDNGPSTITLASAEVVIARLAAQYLIWEAKEVGRGDNKITIRTERFFPAEAARFGLQLTDQMPNLPRLRGVTHTPMVRRDGTILDTPGLDKGSGFLYVPTVDVPAVSTHPTPGQVAEAVALLRGLVDEFKWAGEHDEAAFLGVLLTPLLREIAPGPYKLVGIMAHQRGSGKSLLAWIIREVHGGVFRSEMPHDDAELDKVLISILHLTTAPVVQFDNVSGALRSSRLEGLLTSSTYAGRVLGSTNHVELANDRLWIITGNNLVLAGDLDRRSLLITIDPMTPKPELRTGFKLDLEEYVPKNRGAILHSLLTLVRAWVVSGMPMERRSSDSYAHWSAVVRGILQHAGVPGEFDHASCAPEQTSTDPEGWGAFLVAVREVFGNGTWTAKELLAKVHDGRDHTSAWVHDRAYDGLHPIPLDVLPGELAEKFVRNGAAGTSRSLGVWLRNRNRRFAGEYSAVHAWKDRDSTAHWRVLTSDEIQAEGRGAA